MPALALRHRRLGWLALTLFVGGGLVLEALHGLKLGGYLDPEHALRREMWTLAHAHGALVAVVNLVFAAQIERARAFGGAPLVSRLLLVALVLVPLGFFLGGAVPGATDPGLGVWLVPPGGLALLVACAWLARRAFGEEPPA